MGRVWWCFIGCGAISIFETDRVHNRLINRYEEIVHMLTLTSSAKEYMDSVRGDSYVTLGVKGGGCSGFQYVWGLTDDMIDDHVNWSDPVEDTLVLDPVAEMYVLGSVIDYVTELGGSFLAVKNPMAASSCGCGESFGM
jgi:iron-sulfur cluster insertion protein